MKKAIIQRLLSAIWILVSVVLLLGACQQDDLWREAQPVPEGYVSLEFNTDIPAMEKVTTRAVDPDGGGVQDMTLFCFDHYGLFITTVSADIKTNGTDKGSFEAKVPDHTRIVHFVANQVLTNFEQDKFRNKSEAEVMALLEGSSGRMIYWARFACDDSEEGMKKTIAEQLKEKYTATTPIQLLRNHAKVSVANPTDNGYFVVTGFAVYNTNAFGTVAPYHPEKGFNFTEDEWTKGDFVTLPANVEKLSDVTDVTTVTGRYIFECENGANDPVSVILKGHNEGQKAAGDLYYRVMLMQDGEQIPLRRNHDYQINIEGPLMYGQATFAEALEAAATNNVWISISDKVNAVEDKNYVLTVNQTHHVIDESQVGAGNVYTLTYTLEGKNGTTITAADKAAVKWLDNDVALHDFAHDFKVENGVGKGTVRISLLSLSNNEKLEGTLLVKHGQLQRKIKVITVKKQSFVPSWVGTQFYGIISEDNPTKNRSKVTVMFTVPETCPEELFPMKTYISVAGLDIRAASGMALTVVRNGDKDWYSSGSITSEPDYKYLHIVEKPGVQRVYFENVLSQGDGAIGTLHIEAEHFETMERKFTYSNDKKSITISDLLKYDAKPSGAPDDEDILYRLVPQKKNAHVQFDLELKESQQSFNANEKDEFFLYSQFLDFYTDAEIGQIGVDKFDCMFYPEASETWWKKNNPNAGRMLMFKPRKEIVNRPEGKTGRYTIYLKSNRPQSAEVIRIASNFKTQDPVLPGDANTEDGKYGGDSYRCVTFELANYNPFRFGARLNYSGTEYGSKEEPDRTDIKDIPETVTPSEWTYEPDKEVTLSFDVTSFMGSDKKSVDPFGEAFEIYIDAPMLELGNNNTLAEGKLKTDGNVPGRFVYTVDAKRDDERQHFPNSTVVNKDNTAGGNVNQTGERKTLHFKVKDVVSAGDIVISSDPRQVVFYSKTFRVNNQPITGTIQYVDNGQTQYVRPGAFIAFERVSDHSRIGVLTIREDGKYELRLRKEYAFSWHTDKVRFHYKNDDQKSFTLIVKSLSELFKNPNVILQQEQETPQP